MSFWVFEHPKPESEHWEIHPQERNWLSVNSVVVFGVFFFFFLSYSDVHKMEKEQEVERERDRARSTKIFDPKFTFNDPPPKVRMLQKACLRVALVCVLKCCLYHSNLSLRGCSRAVSGTRSVSACTCRCSNKYSLVPLRGSRLTLT